MDKRGQEDASPVGWLIGIAITLVAAIIIFLLYKVLIEKDLSLINKIKEILGIILSLK